MAAIPDIERGFVLSDPDRDRSMIPYTDQYTAALIAKAVIALAAVRAPAWVGDPGPTISSLVSLAAEAEGLLWDAVADAREVGYTWDQIASRLATPAGTARGRYGSYAKWRRETRMPPPPAPSRGSL